MICSSLWLLMLGFQRDIHEEVSFRELETGIQSSRNVLVLISIQEMSETVNMDSLIQEHKQKKANLGPWKKHI